MMQIWLDSNEVYGAPKIKQELKKAGYVVSIRTVSKYMKEIRIVAKRMKKFKPGKKSKLKDADKRKNYLKDERVISAHTHIVTDITYVYTLHEGWVYFCSFMDLATRKILVWDVSSKMTSEWVDKLLIKLVSKYPTIQLIHSDQGSQYTANSYSEILTNNNIIASYSRPGYPYHNAWIESFHAIMKTEQLYDIVLCNRNDVYDACFMYIEGFYNNKRIHSSLDYLTPDEAERKLINNKDLAIHPLPKNGIITPGGELRKFA